ncbi:hypothetical protein KKE74_02190 [Patescibacteria group bacterium]|nr:hypothetical protein [Patescibacteria group bacterium]MBU2472820.1 hypothetical protein [Patescibacteria group bacterium]
MKSNNRQLKIILGVFCVLAMAVLIPVITNAIFLTPLDNTQISNSFGTANNPDMIWTGSNYGLVWSDSRKNKEIEIYFTRLNGFGEEVASEVKVSNNLDKISDHPSVIWDNNAYAVVWSEDCKLYFNKLDKDGEKYGGIKTIISSSDNCSDMPSLTWDGINYGVIWQQGVNSAETSQIFFIRLDYSGQRKGNEIQISKTVDSKNPSFVWNGLEYGVVWQANGQIYFNKLNVNGNRQLDDIRISEISNNSANPEIIWNGSGYGIIWQGYDNKEQEQIYFAKLNGNGDKEIERAITFNEDQDYSINPSIVWNDSDSEYGIVWQSEDGQMYFVNIDKDGHWKSKLTQISQTDIHGINNPTIALGTSYYAFAWQDARGGNGNEIYFAQFAFSDLAQLDQGLLLAFIKEANGNAWMIIVSVLAVAVLFLIYRAKRKS